MNRRIRCAVVAGALATTLGVTTLGAAQATTEFDCSVPGEGSAVGQPGTCEVAPSTIEREDDDPQPAPNPLDAPEVDPQTLTATGGAIGALLAGGAGVVAAGGLTLGATRRSRTRQG